MGSHPDAFSVGELKQSLRPDKRRHCAIHGPECPVFSEFDPSASENAFVQLHRLSGKNVLVVNNSRKFLRAQADPRIRSRFIHLVRDGRAVMASSLRKQRAPNIWRAARRWTHEVRRDLRLMRRLRRESTCTAKYEEMVAEPSAELGRLCRFVGVPPHDNMIRYWEQDHHFLGGNRGTLLAMLKKRDESAKLPTPPPSSATGSDENLRFYEKSDPANFIDERWHRELTKGQLRVAGLLAGWLNRSLGYTH